MRPSSKQISQVAPKKTTPCPHCGAPGEVYSEQPFYLAAQCFSKSCRRCWYACSKCGHLTLDAHLPPKVCPECGADRRPKPEPDQKHKKYRGIVLPNPYGASLTEEIEKAERERQTAKLELKNGDLFREVA